MVIPIEHDRVDGKSLDWIKTEHPKDTLNRNMPSWQTTVEPPTGLYVLNEQEIAATGYHRQRAPMIGVIATYAPLQDGAIIPSFSLEGK